LRIRYIAKELAYTGKELRSHFLFHQFHIKGDALVAFQGPCDVKISEMVDQEDVKANAPIFSPKMLHFLGEFFEEDLRKTVFRQRLLMAIILEILQKEAPKIPWRRNGDDIFVGEKKVSVSIATKSPVSTLIHAGLNIIAKGAPVPAFGLEEAKISPPFLARKILSAFKKECDEIDFACWKVRGVP
jgi:hypothetical protein